MKLSMIPAIVLACLLAGMVSAQDTVGPQHHSWPPYYPPSAGNTYVANLRSSNTTASAQLYVNVDNATSTVSYNFWMSNIKNYTMSHIHLGAAGVNGPVVVLLLPGLKANQSTTIAGADLPTIAPIDICTLGYASKFTAADLIQFGGAKFTWDDFMGSLKNGTLYGNIHTTDAPGGLIRGQLLPAKKPHAVTCPKKTWRAIYP